MADNATPVTDLVVAAVKVQPLAVSAAGKPYLRMNLVHEDGGEKTWFSGVAFGVLATALSKNLQKGNKLKVTGSVSVKEYVNKKTDKPGTENKLILQSAKVSNGTTVVKYDEFSEV